MKRRLVGALLLLCLGASCAGTQPSYRSDARLYRRAGAFYSAWVRGDFETARKFLSHNFRANDPGLGAFKAAVQACRLRHVEIGDVSSELKMKRLAAKITTSDGDIGRQFTYWIFERGDWYLEVLD